MKENIEEYIKILKEKLEIIECMCTDNCINKSVVIRPLKYAIEYILSDYQNALKENEDWQKAYQEEKEKQFELLRENQLAKQTLKKQCDIADERNQLLKENEELKHKYDKALSDLVKAEEENKELKRLIAHKNGYTQQLEKGLFENCSNYVIPKQKVKDTIEEILNDKEYMVVFEGDAENPDDATIIESQKYIKLDRLEEKLFKEG